MTGLAVVTGAARGIGAATAVRLAADGWSLLLVDACAPQPPAGYPMPSPADLAAVARDCAEAGAAGVEALVADVGDGSVRDQLRERLAGRAPSAVVAAAGVIRGDPAWAVPDEAFDLILRVNLLGVRYLADACVPAMIEAGEGRFVAIASAAALRAMPQLAAYAAAKAGVVGYVRALAADLAGTGVTANAVCPGSTRGPDAGGQRRRVRPARPGDLRGPGPAATAARARRGRRRRGLAVRPRLRRADRRGHPGRRRPQRLTRPPGGRQGRTSKTRLTGVCAARRNLVNLPCSQTARSWASVAWLPRAQPPG